MDSKKVVENIAKEMEKKNFTQESFSEKLEPVFKELTSERKNGRIEGKEKRQGERDEKEI